MGSLNTTVGRGRDNRFVRAALFWISSGLIVFTHFGYSALLWLLSRLGVGEATAGSVGSAAAGVQGAESASRPGAGAGRDADADLPSVSLIVAAYDEEAVIAEKVGNALALDYPRELLEIIVASDGSADGTVAKAEAAGADQVLDLPRGGKSLTQNAAVAKAGGEVLAFSDANSRWQPDALRELVAAFRDSAVAYACGQVSFSNAEEGGDNQEGIYWRYEMAVRELESGLGGVTAGNGAIYAVRTSDYIPLGPAGSHDLSFPFLLNKRGRRSVYVPAARASELMVPTIEGEWARKRRMMIGIWDIVVGEGMFRPAGYRPLYAFQIYSHRLLRYLTPALHITAFVANLALVRRGGIYRLALAAQLTLLSAAALAVRIPLAPFRLARYYVLTTAAIAFGLWDRLRPGASAPVGTWEKSEGTR